ncbi:hypothetical protein NQ318_013630 [Aromia moschata]|uniref:Uncharacterized protein n=1 Tax=Aromia moschata TaxID=1265417 RepID=A0AAV8YK11_9CUCU|nr:hypothetical protein NQ318_013630 [Aromia moschata]
MSKGSTPSLVCQPSIPLSRASSTAPPVVLVIQKRIANNENKHSTYFYFILSQLELSLLDPEDSNVDDLTISRDVGKSFCLIEIDNETKKVQDKLHLGATQRAGKAFRRNSLPGCFHERRTESKTGTERSQSTGLVPEQESQV